jgi:hypothetical protein
MIRFDSLQLDPGERRLAEQYVQIGYGAADIACRAWARLQEAAAALSEHTLELRRTWRASRTS